MDQEVGYGMSQAR